MSTSYITVAIAAILSLCSCTRRDADRHEEPAARQAGRDAYEASQEIKHDAKKAAHDLRQAGKEFREGWAERRKEAKDEPPAPPRKKQ